MSKIENTVFISYRRTNIGFALAVYQNLTQHGYDVFLDYTGINSGNFEQIIIENIKSRAHFIVILTPSALERVHEPDDWLRREIETAIDLKRNIIPLTFENFDWKHAKNKYLTGKLAALSGYNELPVPIPYFPEAMDRLHKRYLNIPLDLVLHLVSAKVEKATEIQQQEATSQPTVSAATLTSEAWFEKGLVSNDPTEKIRLYNEAIRLKPDFAIAYHNRGYAKFRQGDNQGAIEDYNEAIRLKPDFAIAYHNRGYAKYKQGDNISAIMDYNEAIRLKPDDADYYNNRGYAKYKENNYTWAIIDYETALRLEPNHKLAQENLKLAQQKLKQQE